MYIISTLTASTKGEKMQNLNQSQQSVVNSIPQFLADNPAWPLSKRIRHFYADHAKGNIHEVLERNDCPVDLNVIKTRIRDNNWTDIEKILTTPRHESVFSQRIDVLVAVLNKNIGSEMRNADLVKATGLLSKDVSELMNAVYDRYFGLQRTPTNRGYIFFVASELVAKGNATQGNKGIEFGGMKFVKRAKKPEVNTKSINPNWFIVKRFH